MAMLKIETPLLRLFTYFYLLLGAQISRPHLWPLRPVRLLLLCWRLSVTIFLVYGLYTLDCLKLQSIVRTCTSPSKQPLFYSFVLAGTKYTYPALFVFKFAYFTAYGRQLVLLLDGPCFRRVYCSGGGHLNCWTVAVFSTYLIVPHLFFMWALSDRFRQTDYQLTTSKLLEYFCLYMVFNYLYWMCIVMHYAQNGIRQLLEALKERLVAIEKKEAVAWSRQFQLENETIEEIKQLALTNHRLNCLLNAPLLATILLNVFNIILVFSLAFICQPYFRPIVHMLFAYGYTKYLIWCNERVRVVVRQTMFILKARNEWKENRIVQFMNKQSQFGTNEQMERLKGLRSLIQSRRIRLYEMALYERLFAVKVFRIFRLDYHFVLHTGLFIVSLVVFFYQTIMN